MLRISRLLVVITIVPVVQAFFDAYLRDHEDFAGACDELTNVVITEHPAR